MQAAIERVRQHGHCIVTLRRSHHLGRMGHYGEMVAAAGFVLLSFTNVINRAPVVAPFGGRVARLTTNRCASPGRCPTGARLWWWISRPARLPSTRPACWP